MEAINALPADWVNGINDLSLRNGQDINLNYTGEIDSNPYFITDEKVNIDIDSTPIKNFFKVNALVLDSNTALERRQLKTSGQDTYVVGKASDIVYVARLVTSNIFNVISSTVFDVPLSVSEIIGKYDIRFTANNLGGRLVCRLFNGTNEYIRLFNISSQTITLDTAISGLDSSYTFELINAYDVLEEGLEQTTGYPVKGYVIKHVKPNEDCYVKFGKYDIPNQEIGSDVIIYYRKVNEVQPQFIFQDSIDRYGMFSQEINIDFPITSEQLTQISNELSKLSEPLVTFNLDTYRPSYAQRGWKVPVSLTNFPYNSNYSVAEKNIQYIYPKGQVINKPFTKQSVKLQSYYYNLDAILASFKRQSQVKSNIALNQIHKTVAKLVYKIVSSNYTSNVTPPSGYFPSLSRMSAYLKFEEISGNTCIDTKGNVTANLFAFDGSSYPTRSGTSPNRGLSFIDNSAVRVVDNTNIKSVNGGTFLFRLKRTTSPSASQTIALKVTDYHSSAPTQSDYAFLIGTDNKLYAEYSTPQFTASKEFILFESAVMSIPSNGIYCIGFSYNPASHQFKIVFNNSEITWSVNTASYRYYSNINDVDYLVNSAITDLFLGNYVYGSISEFIANSLKLTDELLDFAFCKDEYFTVSDMINEFTGLYD